MKIGKAASFAAGDPCLPLYDDEHNKHLSVVGFGFLASPGNRPTPRVMRQPTKDSREPPTGLLRSVLMEVAMVMQDACRLREGGREAPLCIVEFFTTQAARQSEFYG